MVCKHKILKRLKINEKIILLNDLRMVFLLRIGIKGSVHINHGYNRFKREDRFSKLLECVLTRVACTKYI